MTQNSTTINHPFTIRAFIRTQGKHLSEGFWFALALGLFMTLGPLAAPIALIALYNLRQNQGEMPEPEAATQKATSNTNR